MMLAAVFLLTTALALPQEVQVPANDGWVTDLAGLLAPDEERALEALCESFRAGSTHEIALLIVPDLDGQPIERLALAVGRGWELGVEGQDNGALLLVAQAERALRIEVGRGLEGVLTDLTSGRIIRERIAPAFREGEYYAGLRAGLVAMHSALGGEYGESTRSEAVEVGEGVALLVFMLVLLFLMARSKSSRRGMQAGIPWWIGPMLRGSGHSSRGPFAGGIGGSLGGSRGGGFSGFGGGGGFRGGGATGGW